MELKISVSETLDGQALIYWPVDMEKVTLIKVIATDLQNQSNFVETDITDFTRHPAVVSRPCANYTKYSFRAYNGDDLIYSDEGNVCKLMIMILHKVQQ